MTVDPTTALVNPVNFIHILIPVLTVAFAYLIGRKHGREEDKK